MRHRDDDLADVLVFVVSCVFVVLASLGADGGCSKKDCDRLAKARLAACAMHPESAECVAATTAFEAACSPEEPPTTTTTTTTTLPPPPTTTTTTTTTTLAPQPPASACPASCLVPGVETYMGARGYGQGVDSSVRLRGSEECCRDLGHLNVSRDCHLEGYGGPGSPKRLACELELLGRTIGEPQACPIFRTECYSATPQPWECPLSLDHFGDTTHRDDPLTPEFEGRPAICGAQRDAEGRPAAGFFVIAHGRGRVFACLPNGTGCSGGVEVDH